MARIELADPWPRRVRRLVTVRWTVVIPAKALPAAKSRLMTASADETAHRRLVEAIRADTAAAARAADGVARVLVVSDRPDARPATSWCRAGPA